MPDIVRVEHDERIVTVTLNRPERLNALNHAMWVALRDAMEQLGRDGSIGCVVVRGAGRAFAAGADITEFAERRNTVEQSLIYGRAEHNGVMAVADCPHPTLALIHGPCVGGGLEIACACDIRVVSRSSRFGVPINRLGLTMAYPELEFFLRVVGRAATLEILLEGSVFDAKRAYDMGLVHRVVPANSVEREAYATARRIAAGAPLVNRWHKKFIRRLEREEPLSQRELEEAYAAFGTEDYRTGYRAFLEKRTPEFRGQ